jgi:hypothetical protein
MRNPVPELSRCALLLHGSLYDRDTLVTINFTTGRVLLEDEDDFGLPPDLEILARFRAAYAWSICIETPVPPTPLDRVLSDKGPPSLSPPMDGGEHCAVYGRFLTAVVV